MVWVLLDILVPLLCSFGLGFLLCWLLRRSQGQLPVQDSNGATANVTAKDKTAGGLEVKPGANSAALSELEAANITLIGERDSATRSLDELSQETQLLRDRNKELEARELEQDIAVHMASPVAKINGSVGDLAKPLQLIDAADVDNEERAQLQGDIKKLVSSLDTERNEKRELELQLLNTRNQCEKLESQVSEGKLASEAQADADEEKRATENEWRAKYETSQQHSESLQSELDRKNAQIVELETTAISVVDSKETSDSEAKNINAANVIGNDRARSLQTEPEATANESIASEFNVEASVGTTSVPLAAASASPSGWSAPAKKPGKKERDKLTDIKGVGPAIEKLLHESGVYYFRQIAALDKSGIEELQQTIPQFPGRIDRDEWVKQAAKLHNDKHGATAK